MTREVRSSVDADRAARYLAELAVPRLAGTEREHQTASRVEEHFRSLGLTVALLALIGLIGLVSSIGGFRLPPTIFAVFLGLSGVLTRFFLTYLVTGHGNASPGASDHENLSAACRLLHQTVLNMDESLETRAATATG